MADANPTVTITTSLGDVTVELFAKDAPLSVENFLAYVDAGFYDGTVFHRVIPGFMIQGGGMGEDLGAKQTRQSIKNEADNGVRNTRGSLAMARTSDVNSATSQFFINLADNAFLDHTAPTPQGWGYCVFGRVVEGTDVVDRIKGVKTGAKGTHQDVPVQDVIIERAETMP